MSLLRGSPFRRERASALRSAYPRALAMSASVDLGANPLPCLPKLRLGVVQAGAASGFVRLAGPATEQQFHAHSSAWDEASARLIRPMTWRATPPHSRLGSARRRSRSGAGSGFRRRSSGDVGRQGVESSILRTGLRCGAASRSLPCGTRPCSSPRCPRLLGRCGAAPFRALMIGT